MSLSPLGLIDHIGLQVSDIARAKAFYVRALAPLSIGVVMEIPAALTGGGDVIGFGRNGKGELWLEGGARTVPHLHVALRAATRELVDAFYQAAISAGGRDNGAPGLRPIYHADYYGAFVLDPDGHNIEAVCHAPA